MVTAMSQQSSDAVNWPRSMGGILVNAKSKRFTNDISTRDAVCDFVVFGRVAGSGAAAFASGR